MCEICSKLTINATVRRHSRRSVVFIVNFEQISHLVLVILFFQTLPSWLEIQENLRMGYDFSDSSFYSGCHHHTHFNISFLYLYGLEGFF